MTSILDLRTGIIDGVKIALPKLKEVKPHAGRFNIQEVKRFAMRAPAVRVAIMGLPDVSPVHDETLDVDLRIAAFVITKDAADLSREDAGINIVQGLCQLVDMNQWSLQGVKPAKTVRGENLYSSTVDKTGVAIWAVTWVQPIRLGESLFAPEGVMPWQLYISENGGDHELLFETDPPETDSPEIDPPEAEAP